eukprot:TRINITY_DN82408_c0_g1_i1.p1 TRINITY_DN82408_c0_g1~~TRINITY_DN82408_c0_g1_i1.p1  ORF type:complete len:541 (-),score=100.53 TRINITY_DN82408_c0_g1_i1:26-1546(-)
MFSKGKLLAAAALLPIFAQSAQELPSQCEVASVGAGWSGVYYAFRLAQENKKVCIFEATGRVGGRTYSHTFQAGSRNDTFTLDVGAYRFTPDMHLPGDVILDVLGLQTACYEPGCPGAGTDFPKPFKFNYSRPLVRIVGSDNMPAGYVTAIEGMLDIVRAAGGQLFLETPLKDVVPQQDGAILDFGSKGSVKVEQVLLNLPRGPLTSMPNLRKNTADRTQKMQDCIKFDLPSDFFKPGTFDLGESLSKAYAFYEDAWWHTKVHKVTGQLPENAFTPLNTSVGIPIGIHFNDGPVRCDSPGKGCRGFLEVYYSASHENFFQKLKSGPDDALGVLSEEENGAKEKLAKLHTALMEVTKSIFTSANVEQPVEAPKLLVVGIWSRGTKASGLCTAPTKVYYSNSPTTPGGADPLDRACRIPGLTEKEYRDSVLMPVSGNKRIIVANNDWVASQIENMEGDWAQESLLQAERGLRLQGFKRPEWLDETYYNERVVAYSPRSSEGESTEIVV